MISISLFLKLGKNFNWHGKTLLAVIFTVPFSFPIIKSGGNDIYAAEDKNMNQGAILTLKVDRADNPFRDFSRDYAEEEAARKILIESLDHTSEAPPILAAYQIEKQTLLAVDRKRRRLVANSNFIKKLVRRDATNLKKGARLEVGKLVPGKINLFSARKWALFLLVSQVIQTYIHLEAEINLINEMEDDKLYRAFFSGSHIYYTSKKHTGRLSFQIEINKKSGAIFLVGEQD